MARGVSIAQTSRDPDLYENVLSRWVRDVPAALVHAFPGRRQMKPDQAGIEHMKKEVAKFKMEPDILKKAAAFFAKEST